MNDHEQDSSRTHYVLIDYENVQPEALSRLDSEQVKVIVFLGANQTKVAREVAIALHRMGEKAEYIEISGNGKNALDFHIAYYIGKLAVTDPKAHFHIISKDKGFDPLTKHLEVEKISVNRSDTVDALMRVLTRISPEHTEAIPGKLPPKKKAVRKSAIRKKAVGSTHGGKDEVATADQVAFDKKMAIIISNLQLRGESKPRTFKTLQSTLMALFKNRLPSGELDELLTGLQEKGIVLVEGSKVAYCLPS